MHTYLKSIPIYLMFVMHACMYTFSRIHINPMSANTHIYINPVYIHIGKTFAHTYNSAYINIYKTLAHILTNTEYIHI